MSDSDSESEQFGVLEQHDEDWEDWAGVFVVLGGLVEGQSVMQGERGARGW